ncbi:DUF6807 domain-containing protein [Rubinisphaera margarita]|uniref:DUF6807 domain-containing protein n=1 Tax=Rubinisphaera margarita TaxID=2909586 RepID=UPI001EE968D0|nr:PmoA family protein [Rubinisphaera margarita]MCG6154947.1 PmoA family protein [Rubinisphaera margarita]
MTAFSLPRYQVIPHAHRQVSFSVDGVEKLRWHSGADYPRPFFYPFCGPSNETLTRMGHAGAGNHDHHQSIWFAHHDVQGVSFWSNSSPARIEQREWLAYSDGDDEAVMAVLLDWKDGHDPQPLLTQELIAGFRVHPDGGTLLELQSTFTPTAEMLEFGKTNFGFLAVRVAKTLSAAFGGGQLRDSEGREGEPAIFGNQAKWMDYSGPVAVGSGKDRHTVEEGITYFDHPSNPGHPSKWHVREDGWMGSSTCMDRPLMTTRKEPLRLRYLLFAHAGLPDADQLLGIQKEFTGRSPWRVRKSMVKHHTWDVFRAS